MLVSPISRARTYLGRPQPWLVCIDLQREYVVPGRPSYTQAAADVARVCARLLEHARSEDWRVVHTQVRAGAHFKGEGLFGAPIDGLRPRITEPVFQRCGLSAFSNPDFAAVMRDAQGEEVYVIGFTLNQSCLATALGAVDLGLSVTVVEDAVGVSPCRDLSPSATRDIAAAILQPHVRLAASGEVFEAVRALESA